jgi:hypothetical protein
MGLRWNQIPKEIRFKIETEIVNQADKLNSVNFSGVLHAFDAISYPWYEEKSMRDVVFQSFLTSYEKMKFDARKHTLVSIATNSFGKAGIRLDELPSEVRETILRESQY